jgi:hypothetical protein
MSETTSIIISKVNKIMWKKFRGTALMKGFDSGADCMRILIDRFVNGDIDETK